MIKYKRFNLLDNSFVKFSVVGLFLLIGQIIYGQTDSIGHDQIDSTSQSYILCRGDVIDILVMEHPEFSVPNAVVLPDGSIQFPGIGSINAAGYSIKEFTKKMNKNVERYVVNPIVSIFVKALPTQVVNVVGYVNRPGQIPIYEPLDLITVLSKAGGIKNIKNCKYITIIRADQSYQLIKAKDLFNMKSNSVDIPKLNVGDTVYVVEPKEFNWAKLTFFTSLGYILLSVINLFITH